MAKPTLIFPPLDVTLWLKSSTEIIDPTSSWKCLTLPVRWCRIIRGTSLRGGSLVLLLVNMGCYPPYSFDERKRSNFLQSDPQIPQVLLNLKGLLVDKGEQKLTNTISQFHFLRYL